MTLRLIGLRAVVFDFDGLIIDTETADFRSWQELYAAQGVQLDLETWAPLIGTWVPAGEPVSWNPYTHLEHLVGHTIDREAIRRSRLARYLELVDAEPVRPGVIEWIDTARDLGLRLGVASSSTGDWVEKHLAAAGLRDRFDAVRTRDDVGVAKPDPAVYLRVLDDLGVAPHQALALEDSANGVAAAKAAGLTCIAVPNAMTAGLDLSPADLRIASLTDLSLRDVIAGE